MVSQVSRAFTKWQHICYNILLISSKLFYDDGNIDDNKDDDVMTMVI